MKRSKPNSRSSERKRICRSRSERGARPSKSTRSSRIRPNGANSIVCMDCVCSYLEATSSQFHSIMSSARPSASQCHSMLKTIEYQMTKSMCSASGESSSWATLRMRSLGSSSQRLPVWSSMLVRLPWPFTRCIIDQTSQLLASLSIKSSQRSVRCISTKSNVSASKTSCSIPTSQLICQCYSISTHLSTMMLTSPKRRTSSWRTISTPQLISLWPMCYKKKSRNIKEKKKHWSLSAKNSSKEASSCLKSQVIKAAYMVF